MTVAQDGWTYGDVEQTHAFIQWKGTNACFDFYCECGEQCHWDGYFAYAVRCPKCQVVWEMPFMLYPRKAVEGKWNGVIVESELEEDW